MRKPTETSRRPDLNRDLATLFGGGSVAGSTDGELLDRFLTSRDERAELAFEALVLRHGPMVWGVCRRILTDPTDAEDAFQVTFLVLVRKARSVRVDDSLGRWLYGVSRKVATRTRTDRDRRRRRESGGNLSDRPGPALPNPHASETLAVLDAEVARLPEPFRSAVVLCDLGGLTYEQAALDLGCPVGTIKSRLARGRARLRVQMVRRGFDGGLESALVGFATMPPGLVPLTVRTALQLGGSGTLAGSLAVSGWITRLKGVCLMIIAWKLPWVIGFALLAALGFSGLTWNMGDGFDDPPAPAIVSREGEKPPLPDYVVDPPDILVVEVLEALPGRPITGEHPATERKSTSTRRFSGSSARQPLTGERLVRPDGTISLGFYGDVAVSGRTLREIKVKIIEHLGQFLTDEQLGLTTIQDGKTIAVEPSQSTRVFVDVASYNSKVYYVQGDVGVPGRLPITGNETILDAIHYAGGLIPHQKPPGITLVRPASPGRSSEQVLPIDLKAIREEGETKTNYTLRPGDRLVVSRQPEVAAGAAAGARPEAISPEVLAAIAKRDIPRESHQVTLPDYVVEPPDNIKVEVLNALPGRPITGDRLVRPDGTISLGYYGQVYVAGLTLTAIKEKVTLHLREFLSDEALGLTREQDGKIVAVKPGQTTRVYVDVSAYNSKVYYIEGDVGTPGRIPVTGNETVLDAINYGGGVIPSSMFKSIRVRLVRPVGPSSKQIEVLPVDLGAIVDRGETTTNYQLMAGDRVVVECERIPVAAQPDTEEHFLARFLEVERKLDLILQKIEVKDKTEVKEKP